MSRKCYNCDKDITSEPALKGIKGILCFPCRFKFDELGGEQFHIDSEKYLKDSGDWKASYGKRWITYQKFKKLSAASGGWIGLVCLFLMLSTFVKNDGLHSVLWPVLIIAAVIGFIARVLFSTLAARHLCPSPPPVPAMDFYALNSNPEVVLDGSSICDGNPEHVQFQNGYPPDWDARREMCLKRDGNRCRICGAAENLHIHHVKPISFGGTHTLQNLITICNWCHIRQRYYEHRSLVENNIRANKKYLVNSYTRSDGVTVNGHSRRIGRRGRFWKGVRRARQKST